MGDVLGRYKVHKEESAEPDSLRTTAERREATLKALTRGFSGVNARVFKVILLKDARFKTGDQPCPDE